MDKHEFYEKVYKIVATIPKVRLHLRPYRIYTTQILCPEGGQSLVQCPWQGTALSRVVNSKGELAPAHVFGGKGKQYRL